MLFGREPAFWAAAIRSAIALFAVLFIPLSIEQQGALNAIVAVVLGAVVAFLVKAEKALPFVIGLVESILYVGVAFGWNVAADKQSVIVAFVSALVALITRDRVTAPVDAAGVRR